MSLPLLPDVIADGPEDKIEFSGTFGHVAQPY